LLDTEAGPTLDKVESGLPWRPNRLMLLGRRRNIPASASTSRPVARARPAFHIAHSRSYLYLFAWRWSRSAKLTLAAGAFTARPSARSAIARSFTQSLHLFLEDGDAFVALHQRRSDVRGFEPLRDVLRAI
jgi:hypothetical protein